MSFSLVEFKFSNFRCFRDEQRLSLVSGGAGRHLRKNTISPLKSKKAFRLVNTAVIYGANASGKTSLFHAIFEFITAIDKSHSETIDSKSYYLTPFVLDSEYRNKPTVMELTFIMDGVRYNYGFSHALGEFVEEWLYGYPSTKPIEYFYREKGKNIRFSDSLKGRKKTLEELTRSDSLFLSAASMNGHEFLGSIRDKLCSSIVFLHNDGIRSLEQRVARSLLKSDKSKAFILDLLKEASAGVEDIEVLEPKMTEDEWKSYRELLRPDVADKIVEHVANEMPVQLSLMHRGKDGQLHKFQITDESSGTRKLFALSWPLAIAIGKGSVLVVDELDAQIHELMALSIIEMFRSKDINSQGAQLIFNTHNSGFLKSSLFRKDQIWFTEKDQGGSATLYPLTDFKPREDKDIAKGYIQGLYGAVPWRGQFAF